jgi:starvation-inducible outer membrane lipoprotein
LIGIFDKATLALLTPCSTSPEQAEKEKDPNSHKAYESLHDLKSLALEKKI